MESKPAGYEAVAGKEENSILLRTFPLSSLKLGTQSASRSIVAVHVAHSQSKVLFFVDNSPWSKVFPRSRSAQLLNMMINKSIKRHSPFANRSKMARLSQELSALEEEEFCRIAPCSRPVTPRLSRSLTTKGAGVHKKLKWQTLSTMLRRLQAKKRALTRVQPPPRGLCGCVTFELQWKDVHGILYQNLLQIDTVMALEASAVVKREFDSLHQAKAWHLDALQQKEMSNNEDQDSERPLAGPLTHGASLPDKISEGIQGPEVQGAWERNPGLCAAVEVDPEAWHEHYMTPRTEMPPFFEETHGTLRRKMSHGTSSIPRPSSSEGSQSWVSGTKKHQQPQGPTINRSQEVKLDAADYSRSSGALQPLADASDLSFPKGASSSDEAWERGELRSEPHALSERGSTRGAEFWAPRRHQSKHQYTQAWVEATSLGLVERGHRQDVGTSYFRLDAASSMGLIYSPVKYSDVVGDSGRTVSQGTCPAQVWQEHYPNAGTQTLAPSSSGFKRWNSRRGRRLEAAQIVDESDLEVLAPMEVKLEKFLAEDQWYSDSTCAEEEGDRHNDTTHAREKHGIQESEDPSEKENEAEKGGNGWSTASLASSRMWTITEGEEGGGDLAADAATTHCDWVSIGFGQPVLATDHETAASVERERASRLPVKSTQCIRSVAKPVATPEQSFCPAGGQRSSRVDKADSDECSASDSTSQNRADSAFVCCNEDCTDGNTGTDGDADTNSKAGSQAEDDSMDGARTDKPPMSPEVWRGAASPQDGEEVHGTVELPLTLLTLESVGETKEASRDPLPGIDCVAQGLLTSDIELPHNFDVQEVHGCLLPHSSWNKEWKRTAASPDQDLSGGVQMMHDQSSALVHPEQNPEGATPQVRHQGLEHFLEGTRGSGQQLSWRLSPLAPAKETAGMSTGCDRPAGLPRGHAPGDGALPRGVTSRHLSFHFDPEAVPGPRLPEPAAEVYQNRLVYFQFNDLSLPHELKQAVMADQRLLQLVEAGIPPWAVFLQTLPGLSTVYRPWMRHAAMYAYVLISLITALIGLYDLYKNVPILRETLARALEPILRALGSLDMATRLKYLGTIVFIQNFQRAFGYLVALGLFLGHTAAWLQRCLSPVLFPLLVPMQALLSVVVSVGSFLAWLASSISSSVLGSLWGVAVLVASSTQAVARFLLEPCAAAATFLAVGLNSFLGPLLEALLLVLRSLSALLSRLWRVVAPFLGAVPATGRVMRQAGKPLVSVARTASTSAGRAAASDLVLIPSSIRVLLRDLLSKVFRAIGGITQGLMAFVMPCIRHRTSLYRRVVHDCRRIKQGVQSSVLTPAKGAARGLRRRLQSTAAVSLLKDFPRFAVASGRGLRCRRSECHGSALGQRSPGAGVPLRLARVSAKSGRSQSAVHHRSPSHTAPRTNSLPSSKPVFVRTHSGALRNRRVPPRTSKGTRLFVDYDFEGFLTPPLQQGDQAFEKAASFSGMEGNQ